MRLGFRSDQEFSHRTSAERRMFVKTLTGSHVGECCVTWASVGSRGQVLGHVKFSLALTSE